MRKLGHLLSGLFLVLVFVLSIIFSYFNTTPVSIGFANWEFSAQPISVWIIGAFVSAKSYFASLVNSRAEYSCIDIRPSNMPTFSSNPGSGTALNSSKNMPNTR